MRRIYLRNNWRFSIAKTKIKIETCQISRIRLDTIFDDTASIRKQGRLTRNRRNGHL